MLALRENNCVAEDIVCVWVEDYPCDSVNEARAREQYWVIQDGVLNTNVPNRTKSESDKASRMKRIETIKKNNKVWTENNKERLKEYRLKNKDRSNELRRVRNANSSVEEKEKRRAENQEYNRTHQETIKEYKAKKYQENKEQVKAKRMEYYALHKEEINKKRRKQAKMDG
jgi:hypothetical protein